jgi:hypothetical protein
VAASSGGSFGSGNACDECPGTPPNIEVDSMGCPAHDGDHNRVDDGQDIASGTGADCNLDGIPDECVLVSGSCPFPLGDASNDGRVDMRDVLTFTTMLLDANHCDWSVAAADMNHDGVVDRTDPPLFLALVQCNLGGFPQQPPLTEPTLEQMVIDALRETLGTAPPK